MDESNMSHTSKFSTPGLNRYRQHVATNGDGEMTAVVSSHGGAADDRWWRSYLDRKLDLEKRKMQQDDEHHRDLLKLRRLEILSKEKHDKLKVDALRELTGAISRMIRHKIPSTVPSPVPSPALSPSPPPAQMAADEDNDDGSDLEEVDAGNVVAPNATLSCNLVGVSLRTNDEQVVEDCDDNSNGSDDKSVIDEGSKSNGSNEDAADDAIMTNSDSEIPDEIIGSLTENVEALIGNPDEIVKAIGPILEDITDSTYENEPENTVQNVSQDVAEKKVDEGEQVQVKEELKVEGSEEQIGVGDTTQILSEGSSVS